MKHIAKTTVAAAIAMAFAAPSFAVAPVTVYGKANVSVQAADDQGTDGSEAEFKSNASRLGVKGGVELTDNLQAIYKYEFEINIADDDKASGSSDNIKGRNQFVGLKGNFGEVVVGRNDTILKVSQGKVDQFGDLEGDIKTLWEGENREGDTLTYKSPKFNNFQAGLTVVSEDNSSQTDLDGDSNFGFSAGVWYGDPKLKKTNFYAAIAGDSEVDKHDIIRATVAYKWNDLKLGAIIQNQELNDDYSTSAGAGEDVNGYMVSAAYKIDAWTLKAQYQFIEDSDGEGGYADGNDATAISVGADYKLGKPTKLFAYYTMRDWDDVKYENDGGDMEDDESYFGIGLEHKF